MISLRYGNPARGLRIIAVTGTNGKTTTACYINEILKEAGFKTALFTTAVIEIAGKEKINDLNATVPTVARLFSFFRRLSVRCGICDFRGDKSRSVAA